MADTEKVYGSILEEGRRIYDAKNKNNRNFNERESFAIEYLAKIVQREGLSQQNNCATHKIEYLLKPLKYIGSAFNKFLNYVSNVEPQMAKAMLDEDPIERLLCESPTRNRLENRVNSD